MNGIANSPFSQLEEELDIKEEFVPAGRVANIFAAVVPLAFGLAGSLGSLQLGLGSLSDPGPGLWPFLVSITIGALSAVLLLGGTKFFDAEKISHEAVLRVGTSAVTLIGFFIFLPIIGFEICTFLISFIWLKFLFKESWLTTVVASVLITVTFYLLFVITFRVPLPRLI